MQIFILNTGRFPSAFILLFSISSLGLLRQSLVFTKQRDHRHPQDRGHIVSFVLNIHDGRLRNVAAEPR